MKKYGRMVFLAIAISMIAILTACALAPQSAAPAEAAQVLQFEDPIVPSELPTAVELQQFAVQSQTPQPNLVVATPTFTDLKATSSLPGKNGRCTTENDGSSISAILENGDLIKIEYFGYDETILSNVTMKAAGYTDENDATYDQVNFAIIPPSASLNGQPFIEVKCWDSMVATWSIQHLEYIPFSVYHITLSTGNFYLQLLPDEIGIIDGVPAIQTSNP